MPKKKIFIIAGEASGDWMGCKLIRELKKQNDKILFSGIGGKKMESEGFKSLFPITELSLMGFAEILPHIPRLKRRIAQTIRAIEKAKPDVVVTIDSPGFNWRVVAPLQKLRPKTKFIHYVAPTVWAYKPERAKKIAGLYDKLLVILPFEAPFFKKEGLETVFTGHPVIEDGLEKGDEKKFRKEFNFNDDFVCLMPGSRKGELKRMLPVFKKVTAKLRSKSVILAADHMHLALEAATKTWKYPPLIVDNKHKIDVFAACSSGIIKAGTAGLEFAFANKPYVVAYKVNPLSAYMLRRMIRMKYFNLVNILMNEEVVSELMQEDCEADYIVENLQKAILEPELEKLEQAIKMLKADSDLPPSEVAANEVLKLI